MYTTEAILRKVYGYRNPRFIYYYQNAICFSVLCNFSQSSCSSLQVYIEVGVEVETATVYGYNACILAYGHSGSGKTHTILGTKVCDVTMVVVVVGNMVMMTVER